MDEFIGVGTKAGLQQYWIMFCWYTGKELSVQEGEQLTASNNSEFTSWITRMHNAFQKSPSFSGFFGKQYTRRFLSWMRSHAPKSHGNKNSHGFDRLHGEQARVFNILKGDVREDFHGSFGFWISTRVDPIETIEDPYGLLTWFDEVRI